MRGYLRSARAITKAKTASGNTVPAQQRAKAHTKGQTRIPVVRPLGLCHGEPLPVCFEPELQHPLWLPLLGRDGPHHVLAQALGEGLALDNRLPTGLVRPGVSARLHSALEHSRSCCTSPKRFPPAATLLICKTTESLLVYRAAMEAKTDQGRFHIPAQYTARHKPQLFLRAPSLQRRGGHLFNNCCSFCRSACAASNSTESLILLAASASSSTAACTRSSAIACTCRLQRGRFRAPHCAARCPCEQPHRLEAELANLACARRPGRRPGRLPCAQVPCIGARSAPQAAYPCKLSSTWCLLCFSTR